MFSTFWGGGFECASHRRPDGRRLDLLDSTGHRRWATRDYAAVATLGLGWARDGLAWPRAEPLAGHYRFDDWKRQLEAAEAAGVPVCWDLIHFGVPDHVDVWCADFALVASELAVAAAEVQRQATGRPGTFCPVNEISFLAFAAGEMGWFAPWGRGRGDALKRQLVRAAIAMARALRATDAGCRIVWAEPLMAVRAAAPADADRAAAAHGAQFEAMDWLLGAARPELGGGSDVADVLGFNHYPHNQRWLNGDIIGFGTAGHVGLADLLVGAAARYPHKPVLLAETGAEGAGRAAWARYVAQEVHHARAAGVPVMGACLYPVTDYPGWDDDRCCPTGLLGMPDAGGCRPVNADLLAAVNATEADLQCGNDLAVEMVVRCVPPSAGEAHDVRPLDRKRPVPAWRHWQRRNEPRRQHRGGQP